MPLRKRLLLYWELSKPRLTLMALLMTALGYGLALQKKGLGFFENFGALFWTLVGTAFLGLSSAALNQYLEKEWDAQMKRTQGRPLPTNRISAGEVLRLGLISALIGTLILLTAANAIAAVVGGLTLLFYLGVYTPAKRISSLSTIVGAIPGALPPLLGWTAGYGRITAEGMLLFGILFLWQIPHFLSIAWIYKEDYAQGNFPVLSVSDEKGVETIKQSLLYALALLSLSLIPVAWGIMGRTYFWGALIMGSAFLLGILGFARESTRAKARKVFLLSIVYLPTMAFLMVWDNRF